MAKPVEIVEPPVRVLQVKFFYRAGRALDPDDVVTVVVDAHDPEKVVIPEGVSRPYAYTFTSHLAVRVRENGKVVTLTGSHRSSRKRSIGKPPSPETS